jgi:hypothetical protein
MSATLKVNLATAERLVAEGERLIARHRRIVEKLEKADAVSSETIALARNVLNSFEGMQARRIALRNDLRARLADIEGDQ